MSGQVENAVNTRESSRREFLAQTRVSPASYFSVLFIATFLSAFLIYLEEDDIGIVLFFAALIILPILAFTDKIGFDGKRIHRTGIVPSLWTLFSGTRNRLKITDIEQVETHAVRALKRGHNVKYRFSTTVRGKGSSFTFASGGAAYRQMVHKLLPQLPSDVLDTRSMELRDYLTEPREALRNAEVSRIPPSDVLESSFKNSLRERPRPHPTQEDLDAHAADPNGMRNVANQLRLSGFLLPSLEAFRRALMVEPHNGWLLLECARCLHSLAGSEKDARLELRSLALMRLAEKHAANDADLLARVGESYFQFGDWQRAGKAFRRVSDKLGETFRSVRGLAEMALREGKIAHVIHQYSAADRLADSPSLRRWARGEAAYFSRLNDDDDYLELEISRMNMVERLQRYQQTALRAVIFGFPLIVFGVLTDEFVVADTGWTIGIIAILLWFGMNLFSRFMSSRIPIDMTVSDDEF